jgi:tRNA pseudouridine38-40 synthase
MFYYKVQISYKGSNYYGWQIQPEVHKTTIQGVIHQVLRSISKFQDCSIVAASRTDAGVHAEGQIAKVSIPVELESNKLLQGLNSQLPKDIRIKSCERCEQNFNPIKASKTKIYHYYFCVDNVANPLLSETVNFIKGPVDIELMKQAADLFIGEHDFYNFSRRDASTTTTIRNILSCEILEANFMPMEDKIYYIRICGDGFLKQMVRYIASVIFNIGEKKVTISQLKSYLNNQFDDKLSPKARPHGLHLIKINY